MILVGRDQPGALGGSRGCIDDLSTGDWPPPWDRPAPAGPTAPGHGSSTSLYDATAEGEFPDPVGSLQLGRAVSARQKRVAAVWSRP